MPTAQDVHDHIARLGDMHPPIPLGTVDRTVHDPALVRGRYGHVLNYLARVELEVDRNVLEILTIIPGVEENDRFFYQDVWQPQEIQHGVILDALCEDIDLPAAETEMELHWTYKLLGALAHWRPIQDISRMLFYLTGAATERQAVLAYNTFHQGLTEAGETAIAESVIGQIKRQEPGHFAYYRMSAERLAPLLRPWQWFVARELRRRTYELVGTDAMDQYRRDIGGLMVTFDLDQDLAGYAREIGRLEARILWARDKGMQFPPYILDRMRESVELYREKGLGTVPARFDLAGHPVVVGQA